MPTVSVRALAYSAMHDIGMPATRVPYPANKFRHHLTSAPETIRKPPIADRSPNCIRQTKNKIRRRDVQYGGWNSSTQQCGTWLWDHDIEFAIWQHPAMWHVALGSWHWIRQVAAPCNVTGGSGMTCHWILQVLPPGEFNDIRQVAAPYNVARGYGMKWHWIPQVAAPCRACNVARGSGIMTLNPFQGKFFTRVKPCHTRPICQIWGA